MIVVEQRPGLTLQPGYGTSGDPFPLLNRNNSLQAGNLGGKFALPVEFDSTKLASAFYGEGQEAESMRALQPLIGAPYQVMGWEIWRYPAEVPTGELDSKTKEPIMRKHPMGGNPHKVAGSKVGENFVLMFRPIEVQEQVNMVYGDVSLDMLTREATGETLTVAQAAGDPGMLTNTRLAREMGPDAEDAIARRSAAIHGAAHSPSRLRERPTTQVSR